MIKRLETEAQQLGYFHLYLVTEAAKDLYNKHEWKRMGQAITTVHGNATLMNKDLAIEKSKKLL